VSHKIERASFGLLNERGDVVIGGQSEIAAFDAVTGRQFWRARHTPPGRGIFRTVAAIAARAASLYFRFGGPAMNAVRGVQIARAVTSLSWSGLTVRSSFSNLQALATASNRNRSSPRFRQFGIASRVRDRVDPSRQLDRLSRFLWHRERLATLRGQWMYFYTSKGLVGVNVNNGGADREVPASDLDERFVSDEVLGVMFTASGDRLFSHRLH
jgi:hypothetical protein